MAKREKARSQSQRIIKLQIEQDEREREREKIRQEKIAYSTSTKGIRETKARTLLQNVSLYEDDVIKSMLSATEEFGNSLCVLIMSSIDIETATTADIEKVINECLPALKKLKKLSDVKEIKSKDSVHRYTIYERLFNKLIDTDIRFAMFAPKASIERTSSAKRIETNPIVSQEVTQNKILMQADPSFDYVSSHVVCEFESDNENVKKSTRLIERVRQHERLAGSKMAFITQDLSDNIYTFMENELYTNETMPSIRDIEQVISISLYPLKRLKDLIKNPYIDRSKTWELNPYDNLFRRLINLDVRFSLFAPASSLARLDYDFKQLSEPEKDVLFKHIQKSGLWENEEYVKTYHHVFAVQMAKMNELVKM